VKPQKQRLGLIALLIALALLAALCVDAVVIEPNWVRVTRTDVVLRNLPAAFDGYRIALISDFHTGDRWPGAMGRVRRAVRLVNEELPDLVLLGGDFTYHSTSELPACVEELRKLKPRDGVLAVLGNHDYWDDAPAVRAQLREAGLRDLSEHNEHTTIERRGSRLWIVGIDDLWTARPDVEAALRDLPLGEAVILLSHNPDVAPMLKGKPVDLLLAAHTHGGQVWLPLIGAPQVPSRYGSRYRCGLMREDGLQVYVTRGVGLIHPPVRFLCPAEVSIITLRSQGGGRAD